MSMPAWVVMSAVMKFGAGMLAVVLNACGSSVKTEWCGRIRIPPLMAARKRPRYPSSVSMTAVGWKMVCPSPKKVLLSPVGRITDGMIASPRPLRVAFMSRILGWTCRSPSPWLVKVQSWPVLAAPVPGLLG